MTLPAVADPWHGLGLPVNLGEPLWRCWPSRIPGTG